MEPLTAVRLVEKVRFRQTPARQLGAVRHAPQMGGLPYLWIRTLILIIAALSTGAAAWEVARG
jgi:hypothetical protein